MGSMGLVDVSRWSSCLNPADYLIKSKADQTADYVATPSMSSHLQCAGLSEGSWQALRGGAAGPLERGRGQLPVDVRHVLRTLNRISQQACLWQ